MALLKMDAKHSAGGKVKIPLKLGVKGKAVFSADGKYRQLLYRWWKGGAGIILWIGMNPSTAAENIDDPTVAKEANWSRKWGYAKYVKANVMDYRATNPKDLLREGVLPRSSANLPAILMVAKKADRIVLAYGNLPKGLRPYAEETVACLAGYDLFCLGRNNDGSPKHPLYLKNSSVLIPI